MGRLWVHITNELNVLKDNWHFSLTMMRDSLIDDKRQLIAIIQWTLSWGLGKPPGNFNYYLWIGEDVCFERTSQKTSPSLKSSASQLCKQKGLTGCVLIPVLFCSARGLLRCDHSWSSSRSLPGLQKRRPSEAARPIRSREEEVSSQTLPITVPLYASNTFGLCLCKARKLFLFTSNTNPSLQQIEGWIWKLNSDRFFSS